MTGMNGKKKYSYRVFFEGKPKGRGNHKVMVYNVTLQARDATHATALTLRELKNKFVLVKMIGARKWE